jgi:hypothetical protein
VTFQRSVVIRILLLVAQMLEEDSCLKREIHNLSTHISVHHATSRTS